MKIAVIQIQTCAKAAENLERALAAIEEAASHGAQVVVFPEALSQSFDSGRLDTQAEPLDGPFAQSLREAAERAGVLVVGGMFCPADTVGSINRVYNTALVTGRGVHTGYRKIHTYDAFSYRESDTVKPGEELLTVDVDGMRLGFAICFDIRFPEQFRALARAGAQIICVPTSWADGPGKLEQWRLLTAARALDSTSFVVAAGQARPGGEAKAGEDSGPTGIGHSCVVGPTGIRLHEAGYGEEILYAEIDVAEVAAAREAIPVLDGPREFTTRNS
ncbi:carbon-nitrogen hydrolase family protein [Corynebacterium uropygiale]|uniref:Carbon-nitrogen hydrolase family protein n=1 Tax=Corynebacterium uropygiale TaxID=1775911 RepID=A0A9X1U803_9CORY|nr:carbon-nitrogen hydrolase family protein [Corynebacterium uropygiale]MCF4007282.1 carbon-nitrogen hydrolase family protein [Corynebacterium uropygiale]